MDHLKERWIVSDCDGKYQIQTESDLPYYIAEACFGLPCVPGGPKTMQHICDLHNSSLGKNNEDGKEYECFLSYAYSRRFSSGIGSCSIKMTGKISCIDHIRAIEDTLKKARGYQTVSLIRWKKFD